MQPSPKRGKHSPKPQPRHECSRRRPILFLEDVSLTYSPMVMRYHLYGGKGIYQSYDFVGDKTEMCESCNSFFNKEGLVTLSNYQPFNILDDTGGKRAPDSGHRRLCGPDVCCRIVFFHGGNTEVSRKSSGEQFLAPDLILKGSSVVFIEVKKFATNGLHYRD